MKTKSAKYLAFLTLVGAPLGLAASLNLAGCDDSSKTDGGDSGSKVDGSTDTGTSSTLYQRLGEHDGIAAAVDAIVADELKDPEIASYFYFQTKDGGVASGHPTPAQIKACLVNQLGNAAGGPEKYPGVPADNDGWQCRDMTTAHATLGIPAGTFDKFVGIAGATLTRLGVAATDIATVASVLNGTKAQVVQDKTRDSGAFDAF